jgi:hypothetical protein
LPETPRMARRKVLGSSGSGTAAFRVSFGRQEVSIIKALMVPVVLGLAVAMVIRIAMARRA